MQHRLAQDTETRESGTRVVNKINLTEDFKILFLMQTYKEDYIGLNVQIYQYFLT